MPNDSNERDFELLTAKLDLIREKIEGVKPPDKKETSPWYVVAVGVLGVPAITILMIMNFSQYQANNLTTEKTIQETTKTKLEIEQLRAKATELKATVKSEDIQSLKSSLNDVIPLLQQSASRLERQRPKTTPSIETSFLLRFIVAWAFLNFIGVAFSAFFVGWDLIVQFPYTFSNIRRQQIRNHERIAEEKLRKQHIEEERKYQLDRSHEGREDFNERQHKERTDLYALFERRRARLDLWLQGSSSILRIFPRILQVSLQVAVFVVIIIPMFDLVAVQMGSRVRFENVLSSAKQLDFGKSLLYVRELVVPKQDSSQGW
jgi:hypothetical protein